MEIGEIYRNNKTGQLYRAVRTVKNATNTQDGQNMILYTRHGKYYVREEKEFYEQFTIETQEGK